MEYPRATLCQPEVRELVAELERAGFIDRGGKAVIEKLCPPKVSKPITISVRLGEDRKHYQIRAVKRASRSRKA